MKRNAEWVMMIASQFAVDRHHQGAGEAPGMVLYEGKIVRH